MRRDLFQRPISWVIFILITLAGVFYIYRNFDKANSLVSVDIQMDRESALGKAASLAEKFSLGPEDFKQTVAFRNDQRFQTFVELEAGGLDTFKQCISSGLYSPYYWHVRHFKEQDANEVSFWFKPDGSLYGFSEKIPEAEEGAALLSEDAQKLAEHYAAYNWDVDLIPYEMVEKAEEEQVNGRVDHSFVYERERISIGKGKYRIRLTVSGDKLTGVDYFVKIPDEFERRYDEMRSDNDMIATIALAVIMVIYGLVGVVAAMFFLIRRRLLIWKQATAWGLGIAFASVFLLTLNSLQLSWFSYDTSTSEANFLFRQLTGGLMNALGFGAIIAVSAMGAEGLDRMAFPRHIRFWKLWSMEAGASRQVLGQTIAGYLFAVIILGLDVFYYVTTTRHFGWWSPAGTLSDPNILANYLPWLDSIAISLQAGFWEEILFRAVPIAGIFILTKNMKSRNFWIILVLALQTLVFGAGHANYPNQPSYARVLEMIVPFTIMGIIYIYYGLLPAIIAHFSVDVFWISLPLWVTSAPGIWFDRLMVVLCLLAPLWIIGYFYLRNKKLNEAPEEARNAAWQPPAIRKKSVENEVFPEAKNHNLEKWLIPSGIAGLLLWLLFTPFKYDVPELNVTKQEAIGIAEAELKEKFGFDPQGWEVFTSVNSSVDTKDIFVWQEGGKEVYQKLMSKFLPTSYWSIRFVKPYGEVEERAEEFNVLVTQGGGVYYMSHNWPESKPGASLSQDSAQAIVDDFLLNEFKGQARGFKEISVAPEKLPERTDWEFIYADTLNYPMAEGQGRIMIQVSGNEVSLTYPYVHVPEDWIRKFRDKESKQLVVKRVGQVLLIGIILFGLILAIIRWTRKQFNIRLFYIVSGLSLVAYIIDTFNGWADVKAGYPTQLPYSNFLIMTLVSIGLVGLFISLFNGIFLGATTRWLPASKPLKKINTLYALEFGLAAYGLFAVIQFFVPETGPELLNMAELNYCLPVAGFAFSGLTEIFFIPALFITAFMGIHMISSGFRRKKILIAALVFVFGLALNIAAVENISIWIISAIVTGGAILSAYSYFIRYHFEWLPLSFGLFPVMDAIEKAFTTQASQAVIGYLLMAVLTFGACWYWHRQILHQHVQE